MLLAHPAEHQLPRISEMLAQRPMALLALAAETVTCHGKGAAAFADELRRSVHEELATAGLAMAWLADPEALACPPTTGPGISSAGPSWLKHLDRSRLVAASRRREGEGQERSSYLLEVQLYGHHPGTIYAEVDHLLGGELVQGAVVDAPLERVRHYIRSVERVGDRPSAGNRRPYYRRIKPRTGQRCLAGALAVADGTEPVLDIGSQWPGNRPLLAFLLNNPHLVDDGP